MSTISKTMVTTEIGPADSLPVSCTSTTSSCRHRPQPPRVAVAAGDRTVGDERDPVHASPGACASIMVDQVGGSSRGVRRCRGTAGNVVRPCPARAGMHCGGVARMPPFDLGCGRGRPVGQGGGFRGGDSQHCHGPIGAPLLAAHHGVDLRRHGVTSRGEPSACLGGAGCRSARARCSRSDRLRGSGGAVPGSASSRGRIAADRPKGRTAWSI